MGLEEEAVFYLLQRATSDHQIRSAFTRGSVRGSIYVEGILDANMISLLNYLGSFGSNLVLCDTQLTLVIG